MKKSYQEKRNELHDPSRQYELISDDDRTSHIGIRLTYGLSRKIDYVSHLDLNNLTIRV